MFEDLRTALDMQLSLDTIFLRLGAASLLSFLIGLEREKKDKPAGLRTHMLVGIGSAAFFLIIIELALGPLKDSEKLMLDPTRVVEGIVTGIGFLGAGAIIQGAGNVRGLTTGAAIWVAGAIGLACGAGYYAIAVMVTLFTLLILLVLGKIEDKYFN